MSRNSFRSCEHVLKKKLSKHISSWQSMSFQMHVRNQNLTNKLCPFVGCVDHSSEDFERIIATTDEIFIIFCMKHLLFHEDKDSYINCKTANWILSHVIVLITFSPASILRSYFRLSYTLGNRIILVCY